MKKQYRIHYQNHKGKNCWEDTNDVEQRRKELLQINIVILAVTENK